ncbi:MAG TPA: hypothetical protein PKL44_00535 [Candidatus Dojkabacteria bacterium]|nr:hypothetical protein [Candidatus Dojkabacteria bacterium]
MIFQKDSILKQAYKLQERIEKERVELREKERQYEASKKAFSVLVKEAKDKGILKDGPYTLQSSTEAGRREIDKDRFLKIFGQAAFNKAASIKLGDAEAIIGKISLEKEKGVIFSKEVIKDKILEII